MIQDSVIFFNSNSNKKMIFNHYSYCEFVKWNMVKYANLTYEQASDKVNGSFLSNKIENEHDVYYLTRELPYHWAMILAHGELYWHRGIPYPEPCPIEDTKKWEQGLAQKYNLKMEDVEDCPL